MTKFLPGQSGNPRGRPRNSASRDQLRKTISEELPGIIQSLIEQAKAGDTVAAKLLLDRALPTLKPESDQVTFEIAGDDKLARIGMSIIEAVSRGDIAPDNGNSIMSALATQAKLIETSELIARIEALEAQR